MRLSVWKVLAGCVLTVSWCLDVGAQANNPGGAGRSSLTRSMLGTSVTNLGTQGGSIGAALSRSISQIYPATAGGDIITGEGWASRLSNFRVDCNSEARLESGSQGEGIGLALRVPANFPIGSTYAKDGYYAVLTGPRSDMLDEIFPMLPDPSQDDDLKYLGGEPRERPSSAIGAGQAWRTGAPYYHPTTWSATLDEMKTDDPLNWRPSRIDNWRFGEYQTPGPPSAPSSRSDEWAEEIIVSKWTTLAGVTFTRRNLNWSYPDWDDFFIVEIEFENTGDSNGDGERDLPAETLNDVYISILNNWMLTDAGLSHYNLSDQWYHYIKQALDDWIVYTEAADYSGPGKGLKMFIDWDGDSAEFPWNDTGDPVNLTIISPSCDTGRKDGEFTSYQHLGYGPLAYEDGGQWSFNSRDLGKYVQPQGEQPNSTRYWRIESETVSEDPRPGAHNRKTMFDLMTTPGEDPTPAVMGAFYATHSYGPYTLAPGQKGKLVLAWAGGSPAGEDDLYTWTRSNLYNYGALPEGHTWLVEFFKRAKWAYDNEYDLPDAPPDVYIQTRNSPQATLEVFWNSADNAVNPDYGEQDVAGYRIYRAEWNPDGPWTKIGEVPRGTHQFTDDMSVAGFNYWYSVRTFANGHDDWVGRVGTLATLPEQVQARVKAGLEAGQWAQSQRMPPFRSPKQPAVAETEQLGREPFVVPNPFRNQDANLQYPGKVQIRFVNVPSKSRIRVYNTRGDLVGDIIHDDRTANPDSPDTWLGEAEWDQLNRSLGTGFLPSGVYFFVVESLVSESQGQMKSGKFMVIR